jgi:Bacterial lectin
VRAPIPLASVLIAIAIALTSAAFACGLAITGTGGLVALDADADAPVDAGASPPPDDTGATSNDGGAFRSNDAAAGGDAAGNTVDAAPPCVPVADAGVLGALALADFDTKGNAKWDENTDGKMTLTDSYNYQSGAAWSKSLWPVASAYQLTFALRVGPGDTGGDGVTFAVLQGGSEPNVGDNGNGIGLRNLNGYTGYAVVVDMYKDNADATDLATTTLKFVKMPGFAILAKAGLAEALNDGNEHAVDVALAGTTLTATVHGPTLTTTLSWSDLAFAPTARAYFGFTSSTGGACNSHNEIASLTVADVCQ